MNHALTRSKGFSLQKWIDEGKIRELKNFEPIKEQLRRVFALIGCTPPEAELKDLLLSYIYENYGQLNHKEIGRAFEMAIQGKIQVDTKHYNNFTAEYFSRIMSTYLEWRGKELTKPRKIERQPLSNESHDRKEYFTKAFLRPYKELLRTGVYPFTELDELCLYHTLKGLKFDIPITETAKENSYKLVRKSPGMSKKAIEERAETKLLELSFREWVQAQALEEIDLEKIINERL